jgi:hypothetical protein
MNKCSVISNMIVFAAIWTSSQCDRRNLKDLICIRLRPCVEYTTLFDSCPPKNDTLCSNTPEYLLPEGDHQSYCQELHLPSVMELLLLWKRPVTVVFICK